MTIKLEAIPCEEPVRRYRLRFTKPDDYDAARKKCQEIGYLRFRNGGKHDLIGRPVRMSREMLVIEVDAAEDLDKV